MLTDRRLALALSALSRPSQDKVVLRRLDAAVSKLRLLYCCNLPLTYCYPVTAIDDSQSLSTIPEGKISRRHVSKSCSDRRFSTIHINEINIPITVQDVRWAE